jgi:membrane protein YdbS with pleckstrin-like domain
VTYLPAQDVKRESRKMNVNTILLHLAPTILVSMLLLLSLTGLGVVGWFHSARTRRLVKFAFAILLVLFVLFTILVIVRCVLFPFPRL